MNILILPLNISHICSFVLGLDVFIFIEKHKYRNIQKNRILILEEWKKEIGIPAIEENKRLNTDILQMEQNEILQNTEILALKQENQSLQLQLDEYENEVSLL